MYLKKKQKCTKRKYLRRNKNVHKEETKMYLKKMYLKKKQKCT